VSPSPIEAARARHGLAEVAHRSAITLARVSGSATVPCPFPCHGHPDASPSLRLFLDDGIFYCFGCGARGDVVEWVCQSEGVSWRQAIALLDAGTPLTNAWSYAAPGAAGLSSTVPGGVDARSRPDLLRTPTARLRDVMADAWAFYSDGASHGHGLGYLARRGIDASILERHVGRREVGHTPAWPDALVRALRSDGVGATELIDAGLALVGRDGRTLLDRFRDRVLVPIRDEEGRVCGLVGRYVGGGSAPKYLNSPRTALYDKSLHLYEPLPPSRSTWRPQVVVVEGTLDAMAVAVAAIQRGCAERVVPLTQSGRELSPHQLEHALVVGRGELVLALDGDAAGREATERLASAARRRGCRVRQAHLPDGHDPASLLAEVGVAGLEAMIRTARTAVGRRVDCPPTMGRTSAGPARALARSFGPFGSALGPPTL
jgi:DNA primase